MIADQPSQTPTGDPKKTERTEPGSAGPDAGAAPEAQSPPAPGPSTPAAESGTVATPALARFHSCRWRAQPDEGAYCTHRDVLPMAGKTGFSADSWCPDCQYFKVRRAPRKREQYSY
jgi:hypothetical protein